MELRIRRIKENNLSKELFSCFNRHQEVTRVFRAKGGKWVIKEAVFTEEWGENEKEELVRCLANTLQTRGIIYGAFDGKRLVGFFSIEGKRFGSQNQYVELSSLHVDYDYRGRGIGRKLFEYALSCAGTLGASPRARKLYISSHSAVETQSFYRKMGCVEAEEFNPDSLAKEPCDCQLECSLAQRPGSYMALYMCLGLSIGMLFGLSVFDNLALGMCLGMSVGLLFGVSLEAAGKNGAGKTRRASQGKAVDTGAESSQTETAGTPQPVQEGGTTRQPDNWDSNVGGIL